MIINFKINFKILICSISISTSSISFAYEERAFTCASEPIGVANILNAIPKHFKKDGRPKATAGVILYTFSNKEGFILLGREADETDHKSFGTYSELSGGLDLNLKGKTENFVEGSLRELREESAEIYKLKNEYLVKKGSACYQRNLNREVVMNVVEAPFYADEQTLLTAREASKEIFAKDKDDFKWVKISSILQYKEFENKFYQVEDIKGNFHKIRLRSFFFEMLNDSTFRKELEKVIRQP